MTLTKHAEHRARHRLRGIPRAASEVRGKIDAGQFRVLAPNKVRVTHAGVKIVCVLRGECIVTMWKQSKRKVWKR